MKTTQDVIDAVKQHGIKRWMLRECTLCHYPLCYSFEDGRVFYDMGCDCTGQSGGPQERSYADVADAFNIQTNPAIYKRMWNEFITSGQGSDAASVPNASESDNASSKSNKP